MNIGYNEWREGGRFVIMNIGYNFQGVREEG